MENSYLCPLKDDPPQAEACATFGLKCSKNPYSQSRGGRYSGGCPCAKEHLYFNPLSIPASPTPFDNSRICGLSAPSSAS